MFYRNGRNLLTEFLALESAGGLLLVIAAVSAIVLVNSPVGVHYEPLFDIPVILGVGAFTIDNPL